MIKLVNYLYILDVRRGYSEEDYWVSPSVHLPDRIPMSTCHLMSCSNYPAFQSSPPVTRSDLGMCSRLYNIGCSIGFIILVKNLLIYNG